MTESAARSNQVESAFTHRRGWLGYVFSRDHKIIGLQFLFSSLIWMVIGGLLALAIRWQLAWPWSDMPLVGRWLFAAEGGQISPEFYTMLFTMHGTVMIFFVVIPILLGGFGNYLIPLMIGAREMAFPTLNMISYWLMWPAFAFLLLSFLGPGFGPSAGWTAYPPLSVIWAAAPGSQDGQTFWLLSLLFVGLSSLLGSINHITTILLMRAPGLTMFRLPMTMWTMLLTAILQVIGLPVLTAALVMQLMDREVGTHFFVPGGLEVNGLVNVGGTGQPLLWQHLFWFYSHPAVYIMILPAMGMVSDIISCFSRKPLFGYRPMVYSACAIASMGFLVWGHHMFVSGMNPFMGTVFMVSTMLIALPSSVKVFNWLATMWGGSLHLTTPMLFCIAFVLMFITGGLSGVLMAASAIDEYIHDTYYIVAHFHYVLFAGTIMAVFGAITYWFPKMFGRKMNAGLGKLHFLLSFLLLNGTFFPMYFLGARGFPRRYADPYIVDAWKNLLPMNQFITICSFALTATQLIFVVNFFHSLFWGERSEKNPWCANTLEWQTASPPGHGNFETPPEVVRGPYEYDSPDESKDYYPQVESWAPAPIGSREAGGAGGPTGNQTDWAIRSTQGKTK